MDLILIDLRTSEHLVDLQARRHVAVFAIGLTTALGSSGGVVLGQLRVLEGGLVIALAGFLVLTQLRALGRLARDLREARDAAQAAVTKLIASEVERDVDAPAEAQPGT